MQIAKLSDHSNVVFAPDMFSIVHKFFDKHNLSESERAIWTLLTGYLAQRIDEIPVAVNQSDTAYFCANITFLLKDLHAYYRSVKENADATG